MIASLDVRTLVLVLAIGHAVAAVLLYVDTRRQGYSFDLLFAAGMALQGLGWTLISFRGAIPDIVSFEAGNSLIFAGFCLEGIGLLSLVRPVDRPWRFFYGAVLILVLAVWWMPFLSQDQKMGSIAFVVPFFFIFPAAILVFSSPRPSSLQKFIGATLLLYVAATVARGAWVFWAGGYTLTTPAFFQVLFMLIQILEMILASTGYILIRKESVTADLEADMQERRHVEEEMLAQSDNLEERVKELRCLYQVARIIEAGHSPDTILSAIADTLPAGWKYPDLTCARIQVRGREYLSRNFEHVAQTMTSDIIIHGERAGAVEVFFFGEMADRGESPFLLEETDLLNAVAERISRVIERLEAEKALTESEEKYRALFEQVNDAIFIADPKTWLLTDCNRRAEELTGYTLDEIRGMPAQDLHPDDLRHQTMSRFQAFMEGMTNSIETEVITRNGRRVPVSINATPAEIGGSTVLIGIFRDITWQKEVEKAIRERTEEVDRFFSTSLDLFCIADTDGYFRRLNPEWEKTLGWPVKELEGKRFLDYVHPEDLAATVETIRHLEGNKEVINFVNRYRHRDGTWRWIEWRSYPSAGRIFAAARDITQHHLEEYYTAGLSRLKQELLISAPLETKLRKITDACVSLFKADFARIWITGPGDLCDRGCIHAPVTEGPDACPDRTACLHLLVSSGRYTRTDGEHRRVPLGASMICHVASGGEDRYITNDITHDPRVRDHNWAESLGLVSFAGFRLVSAEGKPVGVLAFFSRQQVPPEMEKYLGDLATTASQVILSAATEDALRESEARLRSILHGSPVLQFVLDKDHRVISWNRAIEEYSGIRAGKIIGTRDQWRAFYPKSRPVLADILIDGRADLLETWYPGKFHKSQYVEGAYEAEDFFPAMGKTGVWLAFTAAPIQDAGGRTIGAVETLEDITERRQMDGAVQAAVKLNQLIDSMSVAESMTYTLDEAERLTSSRIGFFHFLDDDEKTIQLIAWSTETKKRCFIPKEPARHYPVDTAGVWVDCIRERRPVIHNDYAAMPGKKGLPEGHVPLDRELVVPVFDGEKIVAIIGVGNKPADYTGRDIDILTLLAKNAWTLIRRKQTEEELRESEEKYRNIIENIQDMVYRADMDGKFLMISPSGARLLGFDSPEQLTGRPVMDYYLKPEERQAFLEALRKDGSVYGYPVLLKSVDGTVRHVMVSSHFFHDQDGNVLGVEGIIHDITDLRRTEEALRSANRKLTLLSGITRHDIRNQLLALSGYLQISGEVLDDKEKVAEYIAKEQKIAQNIERQIAFTKDYEDLGVKSMEWQDISALVRDAAASLPVGKIALDIQCAGLEVYADPLLRKVFYNLIDNTLHYGGETLTGIRVRVQEEEGGALAVIYEDDGAGISTEDKKKLFTKGFGKHTGLGLFLSREILSITGITITENGEPGNGVRFVITVPKGMFRFRKG